MIQPEKTFIMLSHGEFNKVVEVAVYPGTKPIAFLIIVGQRGTVDGYEQKYQIIASNIVEKYGATVFVVENQQMLDIDARYFVQDAMDFIEETMVCFGFPEWTTFAMGFSAGGLFLASSIDQQPQITRLLLVNPVLSFDFEILYEKLKNFAGELTIIQGSEDKDAFLAPKLKNLTAKNKKILILDGVNHSFSNPGNFEQYLSLAEEYLFYDK